METTKRESRFAANFPYLIWTLIPVPLLFFWFQSRTIDFDSLAIGFDVVVVWASVSISWKSIKNYFTK
ncbi:hypothetical protein [Ekhidna sp.]|uniref:hypothetical protein n=1 Tax=Ekhidna sp. TaxID=2608089 RepID=UPI003B5CFB47